MNEVLQKLPLIFVSEQLTNYTDIDLTYLFVYKYYIFIGLFLVNQFEFLIRKFCFPIGFQVKKFKCNFNDNSLRS